MSGEAQAAGAARYPAPLARNCGNATFAWSSVNRTVRSSTASTFRTWATSAAQLQWGSFFKAASCVTTAAAFAGVPSLKVTFGRSVKVHCLRSGVFVQLEARPVGA